MADELIASSVDYYVVDKVTIVDSDWVESAFMINERHVNDSYKRNLFFSRASSKVTDSSLGGNTVINPKPQYTRYCDVRNKGRLHGRADVKINNDNGNIGMGEYYSEAHDDNQQILILEFGVPKHQSLFSYFNRTIDYAASVKANDGRIPYGYYLAKSVTMAATFIAFPLLSLIVYGGGLLKDAMLGASDYRYYTFKSSMFNYWESVNNLVTLMATERGFIIPELKKSTKDRAGVPVHLNVSEMQALSDLLPDIFTKGSDGKTTGYVDVFALANRTQIRIDRQRYIDEKLMFDPKTTTMSTEKVFSFTQTIVDFLTKPTYKDFIDNTVLANKPMFEKQNVEDESVVSSETVSNMEEYTERDKDGTLKRLPGENSDGYLEGMTDYYKATLHSGGTRVSFAVEYVGSTTDSFSNSLKDIPTKSVMNGIGSAVRNVKFAVGGTSALGDAIGSVIDGGKDVMAGAIEGFTFGLSNVIMGMLGGGFVEMPKMWDSSSASLSKHTYKMTLTSPYGNPISQLMNIDIPLAMLLAGTLPLSIGNTAHTSPFLCKSFLKGVQDIDLGMITDLSITRGVTNLGFTETGRPLSIDVTFTITDFSDIVSAPISGSFVGGLGIAFDDNKPINRYLSTLVARDYHASRFLKPKWILRASRIAMNKHHALSPATLGMLAGESVHSIFGGLSSDDSNVLVLEARQ